MRRLASIPDIVAIGSRYAGRCELAPGTATRTGAERVGSLFQRVAWARLIVLLHLRPRRGRQAIRCESIIAAIALRRTIATETPRRHRRAQRRAGHIGENRAVCVFDDFSNISPSLSMPSGLPVIERDVM